MKTSSIPEHVLYAGKPVHLEQTPEGLRVRVFDSTTKEFVTDFSYLSRILYDRDNLVETIDFQTFQSLLGSLIIPRSDVTYRLPVADVNQSFRPIGKKLKKRKVKLEPE